MVCHSQNRSRDPTTPSEQFHFILYFISVIQAKRDHLALEAKEERTTLKTDLGEGVARPSAIEHPLRSIPSARAHAKERGLKIRHHPEKWLLLVLCQNYRRFQSVALS